MTRHRLFHATFFLAAIAWVLALAGCATTPADIQRWAAANDDSAVDHITPFLDSDDADVRQAAIAALMKMPDSDRAVDALAQATLSPILTERGDAGAALLFNANDGLAFYAITLVTDKNPSVRRRIAEGLAAAGRAGPLLNTQRAGIYLWGLTQDDDADVRAAAAEGLGTLGLNDPIDFALEALRHDPDPRVRAAAARGLGALARAYLAGEPLAAPAQARGEEIVAALCETARTDLGQFTEARIAETFFGQRRVDETHWVASAAADALQVPGKISRADVAAAQAAARARVPGELPPAPAPNFHAHWGFIKL